MKRVPSQVVEIIGLIVSGIMVVGLFLVVLWLAAAR
jgi:hypothetical protein